MKRLFVILTVFASLSAHGQEPDRQTAKKFSFATTFGTAIPLAPASSVPFVWQVSGYYNLTERWSAGVGTGLSFYEKTLLPLYADIRYVIGRPRLFNTFAECAAGYSFALSGSAAGGLFVNPSFGVRCRLPRGLALQLSAGYELQKLERLKRRSDSRFTTEFAEKLSHNGISVKVGLLF